MFGKSELWMLSIQAVLIVKSRRRHEIHKICFQVEYGHTVMWLYEIRFRELELKNQKYQVSLQYRQIIESEDYQIS